MSDYDINAEGLNDAREAITSQKAYETASDNYVKAYRALNAAKKALADAEQAYYAATEELVRHEAKPGIPLYTQAQA